MNEKIKRPLLFLSSIIDGMASKENKGTLSDIHY